MNYNVHPILMPQCQLVNKILQELPSSYYQGHQNNPTKFGPNKLMKYLQNGGID